MKKLSWLFWIALLLAIVFRFWNLTSNPPSLSHDEVAIGYNAYSILKTGRDEYGIKLPLLFRSFDDYKLPGIVYASVPTIALFGLNELGVRFPSAFLGVIAVIAFFGICRQLIGKRSGVATLLFALSPWHINFSRQSFEANGSLTFFMLGVWFLLLFRRQARYIFLAAIFLAISLYFYYAVRLVVPFVLLAFAVVERKRLYVHRKTVVLAALTGLLLISPLLPAMFSKSGLSRVTIVSVINDSSYADRKEIFAIKAAATNNSVIRLLHNRRVALGLTIIQNYFKNFSPKYIFLNGTGKLGLLHTFELPFFLVGIAALLLLRTPLKWIMIAWILAAPLPGAFSTDQPNPLRFLLNAPMFSLLSGLGAVTLFDTLRKKRLLQKAAMWLFALLLGYSVVLFSYTYFYYVPRMRSVHFGDGHKQMAAYAKSVEDSYDAIYMSGYYWRPYIFLLFWQAYDPAAYQNGGSPAGFGKYHFTAASWDKDGVHMQANTFIPANLNMQSASDNLIILSGPEYFLHADKFIKVKDINGVYRTGVFVAATPLP